MLLGYLRESLLSLVIVKAWTDATMLDEKKKKNQLKGFLSSRPKVWVE